MKKTILATALTFGFYTIALAGTQGPTNFTGSIGVTGNCTCSQGVSAGSAVATITGDVLGNMGFLVGTTPTLEAGITSTGSPYQITSVTLNSGSTLTMTGTALATNNIFMETGTIASTFTFDTGTNLSAAFTTTPVVGQTFYVMISNASTQTITISGAVGTTLNYAMTVPTLTSKVLTVRNTGANTWTIY